MPRMLLLNVDSTFSRSISPKSCSWNCFEALLISTSILPYFWTCLSTVSLAEDSSMRLQGRRRQFLEPWGEEEMAFLTHSALGRS